MENDNLVLMIKSSLMDVSIQDTAFQIICAFIWQRVDLCDWIYLKSSTCISHPWLFKILVTLFATPKPTVHSFTFTHSICCIAFLLCRVGYPSIHLLSYFSAIKIRQECQTGLQDANWSNWRCRFVSHCNDHSDGCIGQMVRITIKGALFSFVVSYYMFKTLA